MTGLGHGDLALYRRLWSQARPYWLQITGIFLLSLLATPVALLTPLPLKIVVDSVLGPHPLPGVLSRLVPATESSALVLLFAAVLVVSVALIHQAQSLGVMVLSTYVGEKMVLRFRAELFRHMQRLSLAYHDTRGTADSAQRWSESLAGCKSVSFSPPSHRARGQPSSGASASERVRRQSYGFFWPAIGGTVDDDSERLIPGDLAGLGCRPGDQSPTPESYRQGLGDQRRQSDQSALFHPEAD